MSSLLFLTQLFLFHCAPHSLIPLVLLLLRSFKSVFTITDRPLVLSGGFRFAFDANDATGIGMVLPQWDDSTTASASASATNSADGSETGGELDGRIPEVPGAPPEGGWSTRIWLPAAKRCEPSCPPSPSPAPAPSLPLSPSFPPSHTLIRTHTLPLAHTLSPPHPSSGCSSGPSWPPSSSPTSARTSSFS